MQLLRSLESRIPFWKWLELNAEVPVSPNSILAADFSGKATLGGKAWTVLVEEVSPGHPRQIRDAALRLRDIISNWPGGRGRVYGLIVAPQLSEAAEAICQEYGLGWLDHAGNVRLSLDQVFLHIRVPELASGARARRKEKPAGNLFSAASSRVLRCLLQGPLRPWKVAELAEASGVSLGQASAVRRGLLEQEWAVETEGTVSLPNGGHRKAPGIRVSQPKAVLDAWLAADRWGRRTTVREYSLLLTDPAEIARKLHGYCGERGIRHAFTQFGKFRAFEALNGGLETSLHRHGLVNFRIQQLTHQVAPSIVFEWIACGRCFSQQLSQP